jgi:hypothetical protein
MRNPLKLQDVPAYAGSLNKQECLSMEKVIRIATLKSQPSDYDYWLSRPVTERLDAIEILRKQYLEFTNNVEPRLQSVCRVIKPPLSNLVR